MASPYNPPKLLPGQLSPSEVVPQAGPNGKYVIGARPPASMPNAGLSATTGMGPHHATPSPGAAAVMTASQVRAMQQFLNNHGFQVAQDGVMGPQTKSAAAAFRANHKGGDAWNKAHGIGVHPANTPDAAPGGRGPAGGGGGGGGPSGPTPPSTDPSASGTGGALQALLASLLQGGGNVGQGYDPQSFGNAAAAPDEAAAAAFSRQIGANPKQTAQDQADISSWYGLDPKASSYKLSVLGRLAQAKAGDAADATANAGNLGDLAKALAGSIGGSANDGSSSVLAAGENAAGTASALGQAQSDYASNMDPLLRAEAAGASSRDKASQSQALLDLQDKLAAAQGQAKADRASGVMGATDKNNSLAQQRFANQGNLLSTLAQMQAADPNSPANTLDSQKTKAQIAEINAQTAKAKAAALHLVTGASTSTKPAGLDVGNAMVQLQNLIPGMNGRNLPENMSPGYVAHVIGTILQGAKIPKTDPRYQRLGQTLLGLLNDSNGNPIQAPPGWFGPNTR